MADSKTLQQVVLRAFDIVADEYLILDSNDRVSVLFERSAEWQMLLLDMPPLMPVASAIMKSISWTSASTLTEQRRVCAAKVAHSVLPAIHCDAVDALTKTHGLSDVHLHLNGSTEADPIWLDAMAHPKEFASLFLAAESKGKALEQLLQEEHGLTPVLLVRRLRVARELRLRLAVVATDTGQLTENELRNILRGVGFPANPPRKGQHPVANLLGTTAAGTSLSEEVFVHARILSILRRGSVGVIAHAYFCYLLIYAQFYRLVVQQPNQRGFDQFQKITHNQVREFTEETYAQRFYQMDWSEDGDICDLEGRIAPKSDLPSFERVLASALVGYSAFHQGKTRLGTKESSLRSLLSKDLAMNSPKRLRLSFVLHFIKEEDAYVSGASRPPGGHVVRHARLRLRLRRQHRVLEMMFRKNPGLRSHIGGFDAASNELDTPPEVFAPLFRSLRFCGFLRFTYHVGEDFVHLLSGIRACHEALTFLDLGAGDRLGHATALGIEPELWRRRVGPRIVLNRGERLDDLVFARHVLLDTLTAVKLLAVDTEIRALASATYGTPISPGVLYEAWTLRDLDALFHFPVWLDRAAILDPMLRSEVQQLDARLKACSPQARSIAVAHHVGSIVEKAAEPYVLDASKDWPSSDDLRVLQDRVSKQVRNRGVALEALPTSNVRISLYSDYSEHHFLRWLGLDSDEPLVFSIGTDDPGIFATNMRNEFSHCYRELKKRCASEAKALEILEEMVLQGHRMVFR
ncbi:MAG: hypothetical protein HYX47_16050 [Burkholderiales bacterium]|nr:hypothetical protein [Burkholderiales bacterium]